MHALQQAKRASARHTNNNSSNTNGGATGLVTRVQPKQNERGRLLIVSGKDLYFLPETLNLGQNSNSSSSDIFNSNTDNSGASSSAASGDTQQQQQHSNSGVMDEGNSARTSHVKMLRW